MAQPSSIEMQVELPMTGLDPFLLLFQLENA
jgi:hypothetical protein